MSSSQKNIYTKIYCTHKGTQYIATLPKPNCDQFINKCISAFTTTTIYVFLITKKHSCILMPIALIKIKYLTKRM